jgi:hypothetical protein
VRRLVVLLVLFVTIGGMVLLWMRSRDNSPVAAAPEPAAAPRIDKQPPVVSTRRFNPAAPPAEMPPLHAGELAVTDSNFGSLVRVSSQTRRTGVGSAVITITGVKMDLHLTITIWVPEDVTLKVLQHEEGHRQISEFFYQDADKIAARVASDTIGRELTVTGSDLDAEANQALQKISADINAEYASQLNADAAQLHYDDLTDHARNDVPAKDAVAEVLAMNSAKLW